MNFQRFAASASDYPCRNHRKAANVVQYMVFRDNFKLTTWLALGALVQTIILCLLPPAFAVAPVSVLLTYRLLRTILMYRGLIYNTQMEGVLLGKYTAQIPGKDDILPEQPSEQELSILILAARSNHALGMLGPGYKSVSDYINSMVTDLWENGDKYGFLSETTWIAANERHTNNQIMVLCYFRSMEGLHSYAHGPRHRKAWRWWNSITATHPHLSIMHEMYQVPKNHWENIFINNHLTGIAHIQPMVKAYAMHGRSVVDASRGNLRTQMGRLGRGDGKENEIYGPEPYNSPQ